MNAWISSRYVYNPLRRHAAQPAERVLVVMRPSNSRQQLIEQLQKAGYTVVAREDCHDALQYCRQTLALHGLVVETELPRMWGLELSRCASQCHRHLAIVCVFRTEPKPYVKHELAERGWQWIQKGSSLERTVIQKLQTAPTTFVAS